MLYTASRDTFWVSKYITHLYCAKTNSRRIIRLSPPDYTETLVFSVNVHIQAARRESGIVCYSIWFNVPLDTLYAISETILRVRLPQHSRTMVSQLVQDKLLASDGFKRDGGG